MTGQPRWTERESKRAFLARPNGLAPPSPPAHLDGLQGLEVQPPALRPSHTTTAAAAVPVAMHRQARAPQQVAPLVAEVAGGAGRQAVAQAALALVPAPSLAPLDACPLAVSLFIILWHKPTSRHL